VEALPRDYDDDPGRWASHDRGTYLNGYVHEEVARRVVELNLRKVLDVGCGNERLRQVLPTDWEWIGVDSSPTQLSTSPIPRRIALADATQLPVSTGAFDAVACLWMLHHLQSPVDAIREARRVLRPGGAFFACTSARTNDPELTDGYPATTFDAEDAPSIVAEVFGERNVEVISWDAKLARLEDAAALRRYRRSHFLPDDATTPVSFPLPLTKRGCLVIGYKPD
jgi:SAM-dependent methyltransferase